MIKLSHPILISVNALILLGVFLWVGWIGLFVYTSGQLVMAANKAIIYGLKKDKK